MKKVFFIAILSLVSVFCIAAKTAEPDTSTPNYTSSVTVTIAGVGESIDFDTSTLVAIYKLMPAKVKELCVGSYKIIAPKVEKLHRRSKKQESRATCLRTQSTMQQRTSSARSKHVSKSLRRF